MLPQPLEYDSTCEEGREERREGEGGDEEGGEKEEKGRTTQLSAMLDNPWAAWYETIILTILASVVDGEPKETHHPAHPVICQLR